jgi:hypothetical protein
MKRILPEKRSRALSIVAARTVREPDAIKIIIFIANKQTFARKENVMGA